jgi:hypothetical protein
MMNPGEQTTGTRDEHFDLISVLYHALHGAENCNTYALDAEAAGENELVGFFREAGIVQARLAERAKALLGITEEEVPPEGGVPPSLAEVRTGEVPPPAEEVPQMSGTPSTALSSGRNVEPPLAEVPADGDTSPPDSVVSEEAPPDDAQAATGRITSQDFDPTLSALEGGIAQLTIAQALAEIETWERKLEATGDPELQAIAGNLGALRGLLTADDIDASVTGPLLTTLGEQVQGVASGGSGAQVADKLRRLGELLTSEGRSLSG